MSELPDGIEPAPIPEPKDSALGIVVRRGAGAAFEVLLGLRAKKARFMPGNLAFPGGKLDAEDRPEHPGALARCASRELREETGLSIPPEAWRDAGERVTPPFYAVRFRTRFFVAEAPADVALPAPPPSPEEIEALQFHDPRHVLASWEAGRALVPPPLLPILRAMIARPAGSADDLARLVGEINAREPLAPRIEFVPDVWGLPLRTRTLPPASCTNVWIPGVRRFVVVDPGSSDPAELDALFAVLERRRGEGATPEAVVLTHHHRDHVGGAAAVARALGVPIRAHAETFARLPELPGGVAGERIADGAILDLGGMTLRALHTPGHAPGHLAFFDDTRRVLIAGDLVSGLSTILVGDGPDDMERYLASLARVEALDARLVLPAHGPPVPARALAATRAHRAEREARVLATLTATPRELATIAREVYADTPGAPAFLTEMQTRAHLAHLASQGRARRSGSGADLWSTS